MIKKSGSFVTIEGGDGSGKSTQVTSIAARARDLGHHVVSCREPGGTPLGERLRNALLDNNEVPSSEAELLVFAAARAQLVRTVILPALQNGALVLCDRFADSTIAYQEFGRGIRNETVTAINTVATGGLKPDLTVLLDIAPEAALVRNASETNYMEREDLEFHQRVHDGYLKLAEDETERWLILDASLPVEEITNQIWTRLTPML